MKYIFRNFFATQALSVLITFLTAMLITPAFGDTILDTSKGLVLTGAIIIGHGPGTLIIRDGRIEAITSDPVDENLKIFDVSDRYIVPTFIDSHVHLAIGYSAKQLTQGGIAAAVDLSAPLHRLATNYAPLSIKLSGPMVTALRGYPTQSWGAAGYGLEAKGVQSVRTAVDFLVASGARVTSVTHNGRTVQYAAADIDKLRALERDIAADVALHDPSRRRRSRTRLTRTSKGL